MGQCRQRRFRLHSCLVEVLRERLVASFAELLGLDWYPGCRGIAQDGEQVPESLGRHVANAPGESLLLHHPVESRRELARANSVQHQDRKGVVHPLRFAECGAFRQALTAALVDDALEIPVQ
jgi:hypothetical protein